MPDTGRPDVLGMRLAHRAMRADLHRLTHLAELIGSGGVTCSRRRAAALAAYAGRVCDGVRHHHDAENRHLWPVLARVAGAEIDLCELVDDHAALDPLLDRACAAVAAFAHEPGDPAAAQRCAYALRAVRDLLDEHVDEEERTILPVIDRYVTVAQWRAVEQAARRGADPLFDLCRRERVAEPAELAALRAATGPVSRLLLALLRPGYRRRERLIFG
ncbi:hypothetical protein Cs7R123_25980 [Catellatospora sp. TT07R-123]|uniref:hemerythrin domain-containing protein n=1 Tax=Catellatospora sp. TT07R-123 TaxID=2733863 RepID=UPI001B053AAE|nr:hemerythrin domain-containing protein [Catellatospora sp. TT07R-123]GHJ45256.1 hypothetical protein Cs7R123_25980 [Catellatospora sp. TT07R-123]